MDDASPLISPPGAQAAEAYEGRDPRVAELCAALFRAYRAVRFYPAQHPSTTESLRTLYNTFAELLELRNVVILDVDETSLLYEDQPVFVGDQIRDNLAFLMYRDGIRTVRFRSGVRPDELLSLVNALAQAETLDRSEHDLATVLWEHDFDNIQYDVVDPLLEADEESSTVDELRSSLEESLRRAETVRLEQGVEPDLEPRTPQGEAQLVAGLLASTEDLEHLEARFHREADILHQFLGVLSEVLVGTHADVDVGPVARATTEVLHSYLEWGEFAALEAAITRLRRLQAVEPMRANEIEQILRSLASTDRLRKAVFGLDGPYADRRTHLENVLVLLRSWAQPVLVQLLMEAGGMTARKTLLNVLMSGEPVPASEIVAHLNDPRWYVVRNMVLLLGSLRDDGVLPALERTLAHPDERVRREVVRALSNIEGPRAAYLVTAALDDPSSSVRVLAARSLTRLEGPRAMGPLLGRIRQKEFANLPESEIQAFCDALGEIGGDEAVTPLDDIWESRSFLRGKPMHLRLAVLRALGQIGTQKACQSLLRATRSGDDEIRRQAKKCLAEAERKAAAL